jgi:Flp pilus assembly protein TadB
MVLCVAAAMLAAGYSIRARPLTVARLTRVLPPRGTVVPAPANRLGRHRHWSSRRVAVVAAVATAGVVAIGGPLGLALGLGGATVVAVVRPKPAVPGVNADEVPVVVDLIAGCLAAGALLPDALDAAAVAGDDVMRSACRAVATALRSGAPPEEAWRGWLADPWLAPVARTAVRTTQTGAAAAADLNRTASRLRARRRAAAQQRLRQAAVWLVVPLGLCFLPAFVLLAVVPLVVGLVPSLR